MLILQAFVFLEPHPFLVGLEWFLNYSELNRDFGDVIQLHVNTSVTI